MIQIRSLCAGYGKEDVLKDISLLCEAGTITTLIGPNGCGKSTLLKALIGMVPRCRGQITLDGVPLEELSDAARGQKLAYLSQGKNVPDITVERMVLHGRFPHLSYPRRYRRCDLEAAREAMERMELLPLANRPLAELSGGMRQKVYLAMALCQGADIIVLDEPATYLDIGQQLKLTQLCRELAQSGKTVILVSHDIISALKHSHQIAVMDRGRLLQVGTPEQIIQSNVIPQVFGVEVVPFEKEGGTEYYYRKEQEHDPFSAVL